MPTDPIVGYALLAGDIILAGGAIGAGIGHGPVRLRHTRQIGEAVR